MASLEENSVDDASISLGEMREAQRRLQQYQPSHHDTPTDENRIVQDQQEASESGITNTATHGGSNDNESRANALVVSESVEASIPTPTSSPSKDAPVAKPAIFAMRYPGGDTQQENTQVMIRSYSESIARLSGETLSINAHGTNDGNTSQYYNGESGHVDLAGHLLRNGSPTTSQPGAGYDDLLDESQPGAQIHAPTKPPHMPETPAAAGKRHARDEAPPLSDATAKTPGFTQAFGLVPQCPAMTVSQAFQEVSSPVPEPPSFALRSDAVDTRPSPNANHHEAQSSAFYAFSSSPASTKPQLWRPLLSGDPRDDYQTRSQEEREARLGRGEGEDSRSEEDDEMDDTHDRKCRARAARRAMRITRGAPELLRSIRAPSLPGRRHPPAREISVPVVLDAETPATVKRHYETFLDAAATASEEGDGDDDLPETRDLPGNSAVQFLERDNDEIETEDENSDGHTAQDDGPDNASENDEYDELGQEVLKSQADPQVDGIGDDVSGYTNSEHEDVEMQEGESRVDGSRLHGADMEKIQATPRSTIADSQPTAQLDQKQQTLQRQGSHSFTASYVPGSQYAGRTSQDLALLKSPPPSNMSRVLASQVNTSEEAHRLPSSPPLPMRNLSAPEDSTGASLLLRKELLDNNSEVRHMETEGSTPRQEIPESDTADSAASRPQETATAQADSIPLYSIARSHISGSMRSPMKPSIAISPSRPWDSQRSRLTEPSPRKPFALMAAEPSLLRHASSLTEHSEVNIDAIMDGFIDQEFVNAVSSPHQDRSKRRKLAHPSSSFDVPLQSTREVTKERERSHIVTSRKQDSESDLDRIVADSEPDFARPEIPQPGLEQQGSTDAPPESNVITDASNIQRSLTPSLPLRDSRSKVNEMSRGVADDELKTDAATPESVRQREEAGRAAVSQLISSRANSTSAKKLKQVTYGRASKRKSGRTAQAKAKVRSAAVVHDALHDDDEIGLDLAAEPIFDGEMANVLRGEVAGTEDMVDALDSPRSDVRSLAAKNVAQRMSLGDGDDTSENDVVVGELAAPERVWARFRGQPANFYPATWLGASPDGMNYKIKFDDETVTYIETQHVRRLEVQIGDMVKVDGQGSRNKSWVIVGFGAVAETADQRALGADIYGHTTVKVRVKSRDSMPGTAAVQADTGVLEVLVNTLYLTSTMWPRFHGRDFTPPKGKADGTSGETPGSTRTSTPTTETPASRSRRASGPINKRKTSVVRGSNLREASVASSDSAPVTSMFQGMAFAISYVSDEVEKAEVTRRIQQNGGIVLHDGFEELFELPDIRETCKLPGENHMLPKEIWAHGKIVGLELKAQHRGLGFVALLADRHSRRTKYIQALALGLPILSGRWVLHSVDASKNANSIHSSAPKPLAWDKYLLPAGESSFLGGAIKSRTLVTYDASLAHLSAIIAARPLLLHLNDILIVAPKKASASSADKRKTFVFLTLALGARLVRRVHDVHEAKALISADPARWQWVYVDSETSIAEAETILFAGKASTAGGGGGGKKRKKAAAHHIGNNNQASSLSLSSSTLSTTTKDLPLAPADDHHLPRMFATDGVVAVVNDEFVVQSLILGALAN